MSRALSLIHILDETTVRQLIKDMGTDCSELTQIRSKDGVSVYRVKSGNGRYVLKAFDNAQYCREIGNYLILHGLRVPTIGVIAYTDNALLLEDLESVSYTHLRETKR